MNRKELTMIGNASSLPPRLPDISKILRRARAVDDSFDYTIVCLSYRGYWTSHDRPSESGINMDATAALRWITRLHESKYTGTDGPEPITLLWGQSIGCGFATNLAASADGSETLPINGLVLETPFTNTRAMLKALYPQKWLPYQYLWPFLRNHLDSLKNFGTMADRLVGPLPAVHIVEAAKDELVPQDHGKMLEERCRAVGLPVERYKIGRALHNEVMVRAEGQNAIAQAITSAANGAVQARRKS